MSLYDSARRSHLGKVFSLLEREDMNFNGVLKDEATLEEERKEKAKGTAWLTNFDPESEFTTVIESKLVNKTRSFNAVSQESESRNTQMLEGNCLE